MKTVTLLKTLTFVMAAVIIAGTTFVACKISDLKTKSKTPEVIYGEMKLDFPETINSVTACGDRLCLITVGHEAGRRLIIVNPETGKISAILTFSDQS